MNPDYDPMGHAIADYHRDGHAAKLQVLSPDMDEDELPVEHLFRSAEQMPPLEREALRLARGRVLDVGAGAGCHSLALQWQGFDVEAIDISPLAVATMRERGVVHAAERDFFDATGRYDTILMLMNGIGIVGSLARLPELFARLDALLAPGGQLLCDSSDIAYLYEDDDGFIELPAKGYYGEMRFQMAYRHIVGQPFPWLYIDADTLATEALHHGYRAEIVATGDHYDYLARIIKL